MDTQDIFIKAKNKALNGGLAGSASMVMQVSTLMWLRTTMNYQYANGGTITQTIKKLYSEGGVRRFYRGYLPAIFQGPISRFGDTAMNVGILELTKDTDLPIWAKTGIASGGAASWRLFLMPIDALKTTLQVHGNSGLNVLNTKLKNNGPKILWNGTGASISATFVGHYPWFVTYNYLTEYLENEKDSNLKKLTKNAGIGFVSSVVSDTSSNSLRVVKTYKQTYKTEIGYSNIIKDIIKKESIYGLLFRGLETRILVNGLNGMMFSVLWKYFRDYLN